MVLPRERVLVVEDEKDVRDLIVLQLQRDGYLVETASSGEEGARIIQQNKYDLILLDWMLPGVSGLELARIIRNKSQQTKVPVLMVTARADSGDIIAGLEAGADDYVTKPFDTSVLMARVRSLLRRSRLQTEELAKPRNKLTVGGLELDLEAHEVHCDGVMVHLTPSEFKLLQTLISSAGKVLTREALIQEVQGEGVSVVDRAIDTHVFGLRKKLGNCADLIETIRGIGYRVKNVI
jgi:two-component system phosphate regulon response regulator PhoB